MRFQVSMSPPCSAERMAEVGPELHRLIGIVGPPLFHGGPLGRRHAASVGCQRHLASSSIATATDRQRCLTSSQSALASGSDH